MTLNKLSSRLWLSISNGIGVVSVVLVLVILLFVVPYAEDYIRDRVTLAATLRNMWRFEQWQHCWLVLPAVGFLVYSKRKDLIKLPIKGANIGLVFLLLSLAFFWVGYRVENYYIGFFSIQFLVGALIIWLLGWKWFLTLLFPYMFLGFVWPLYFLETSITFPLRMIMSKTSVAVLNGLGIDVIRSGTGILSAPDPTLGLAAGQRFSVDVADPCSGIRSLFALMMVSALYGYFTMKTWWKHLLLFLSSIPLAILGNLCRILMLTFGTIAMGPEIAIGTLENPSFFHMLAGYLVFAVALVGMVAIGWLLNHVGEFFVHDSGPEKVHGGEQAPEGEAASTKRETKDESKGREDLY